MGLRSLLLPNLSCCRKIMKKSLPVAVNCESLRLSNDGFAQGVNVGCVSSATWSFSHLTPQPHVSSAACILSHLDHQP